MVSDAKQAWQGGVTQILQRRGANTIVEIVVEAAADGDPEALAGSRSLAWWEHARTVYRVAVDRLNGERSGTLPAHVQLVDPTEVNGFLQSFPDTIDLLYLDGWEIGTPRYRERHGEVYQSARERLHDESLILIGDTDRDNGGKGAEVVLAALADGFQVLRWGAFTLLGRRVPEDLDSLLPNAGPPPPGEASYEDAIRLHQRGQLWEAAVIYRRLLEEWPEHDSILHLLGVIHHQQNDHDEALKLIGKAISLNAGKAIYFNNYGAALQSLGRYVEALACFHHALHIRPKYADAHANLGMAQESMGQFESAARSYETALEFKPEHHDAVSRLSSLLQKTGRQAQAIKLLEQAIKVHSDEEFHITLGNLLLASGRADQATANYERALALNPNCGAAFFNLGGAYVEQYEVAEAQRCFARASELRPDKPLWKLRATTVCPAVFRSRDEMDRFRELTAQRLDEWLASRPEATFNELLTAGAFPGFPFSYQGTNNRGIKEKFAAFYEPYFVKQPRPRGSGLKGRKRIGIVVTQRHEGIFLRCFQGIIDQLDGRRFEIVLICSAGIETTLAKSIRRSDLRIVTFNQSLLGAMNTIREVRCDLIYYWEVGSDSMNYFLPFGRLAPVQCTSHGSQVTSGLPAVDYFFTSELMERDDADDHYTETLWRSKTLLTNQSRQKSPAPVSRDHFRLPAQGTLYICFQNPMKIHPDLDAIFADILGGDPAGTIVLLQGRYGHARQLLQARFAETLGDVSERVTFLGWQKFDDYCRLLQLADVVLDPLHFGAGSSSYDVFSFNQPAVTMPGELIVGRVAYAFYKKMGIEDLIANSRDEYVRLALRLGTDRDFRMAMKRSIAAASDAVFDDLEAVREHERFFDEALS